jgi:glycerophosphoryl diester phosphodiesterase
MRSAVQTPFVIGHRGACGYAPENTLASIAVAAQLGATWVEVDVCITKDAVAVLMHDDQLTRTTSGHGLVLKTRFDELKNLDAGSWFDSRYANEPIPKLKQALELCASLGLGVNLEIKPSLGYEAETAEAIIRQLQPYIAQLPLLISSFNYETLMLFKTLLPHIPRGYLTEVIPKNWQHKLQETESQSLHFYAPFADSERIATIKAAGYRVLCYTVNQPEQARQLISMGVEGVFTDYPDRLLEIHHS